MKAKTWLPLAGALVLVAAACGGDSEPEAVTITITDAGYTVPASLEAGVYDVTLVNETDTQIDLVMATKGDASAEQFFADFAPVLEGGPFPEYLDESVGLPTVLANATASSQVTVPPGNYIVFYPESETQPPAFAEVAVTGDAPDPADLPDDAVVRIFDYGFEATGLESGTQTVTVRNDGPGQFHHVVVMEFPDGVDEAGAAAAIEAFFAAEEDAPPPEGVPEPEDVGASGVFSPGEAGTMELTLKEGRTYGFFCFISDTSGGAPHAFAYNMVDFATIS